MIGLPKANHARGQGVQDLDAAYKMLDIFASAGATHFDLTHTNIDSKNRGFRPRQSLAQLKNSMPRLFPGAAARQNNIIVRPLSDRVHFVQLDDLDKLMLSRVGDAAFLTLQTSPGNHQAWIAVSGLDNAADAKDFARRLRKGAGADPTRMVKNLKRFEKAGFRSHNFLAQLLSET